MAKAVELVSDVEFVSQYDDDEQKTTWILRSLTGLEYIEVTSGGFVDHEAIIRRGLVGWKNFPDSKGNEIEFSQENIGRVPPIILQDISFKIQSLSELEDEERKN